MILHVEPRHPAGRKRSAGFCKRMSAAIAESRGTLAKVVVSFFAGIVVTLLLTQRRDDYVSGVDGRNEARHWLPENTHYEQESLPGRIASSFFGRFLGYNDGHDHEKELRGAGNPVGEYKRKHVHEGDDSVAEKLRREVRVLCWVLTSPKNHKNKAVHVKATWGKRCNVLLFMSTENDSSLPAVHLNITEGRSQLWNKTRTSLQYIYNHYLDEADWFMKADDDSYVVVENLRYMLRNHSPEEAIWFGCNFRLFSPQGYMSGGAGYVMSKEALRRFVDLALPNNALCGRGNGAEDAELGKCLQNVNVTYGDSRDHEQRWRFFPFQVETFVGPSPMGKDMWFWDYIKYPFSYGPDCCSDTAVTFHYISPGQMYVLDYLIYHLKPYGRDWSRTAELPGLEQRVIDAERTRK